MLLNTMTFSSHYFVEADLEAAENTQQLLQNRRGRNRPAIRATIGIGGLNARAVDEMDESRDWTATPVVPIQDAQAKK